MYLHARAPHLVTFITPQAATSHLYDSLHSAIAATSIMHTFGTCEDSHIIGPDGVVAREDILDVAREIVESHIDIEVADIPSKVWDSVPQIDQSVRAYAHMTS